VLTQNTAWKNVERAIANLRDQDLLRIDRLSSLPVDELADLIRPAGYYRLKARRLKNLVRMIDEQYDGSLQRLFALGTQSLREALLRVNGVGPETADCVVLYAASLPTFVIDAYTARVFKRHGWIEPDADYAALKDYFESVLDRNVQLYNEYHALLVRVGNQFCRKAPKCEACPLRDMLPEHGPLIND
jgi:endonuclease-3 related protein